VKTESEFGKTQLRR